MPQIKRFLKGYKMIPQSEGTNVTIPEYRKWNKELEDYDAPAPQIMVLDPETTLHVVPQYSGYLSDDEKAIVHLVPQFGERVVATEETKVD